MDIANKTIWQIAAGDTDRNYADLCLKWDVILNGPGGEGKWPDCRTILQEEDGCTAKKLTDIEQFAQGISEDDVIVLRVGTSTVRGVGRVIGSYEWREEFGDIDGWDLQHVRRVLWFWRGCQSFDVYALKWGPTTQRLNDGPVSEWLSNLTVPSEEMNRSLVTLPLEAERGDVSIEEISEFLFDRGVASGSITSLVNEIGELIRIAKWYQRSTAKPSEHETVAYLVVPLLRALGWTPQKMAVEWNNVDVALFDKLPRADESVCVVVEAKKMGKSCLAAQSQAMSYAVNKTECRRLIVTDGLRYGVYTRNNEGAFNLYAYMNLTRLRNQYAVYDCKGASDALLAMAPEWKPIA
jgi:hypothetical protein